MGGLLVAAACYAWATPVFNAPSLPRFIAFAAMGTLGIAVVFCWPTLRRHEGRAPLFSMVLIAVAARLLILPAAPSDDVNRYLWEGALVNAGESPYAHTADDPAWLDHRDRFWEGMNHRDKWTAYPPLAQLTFAAIARIAYHPIAFKLVFLVLDLATLAALLVLLRRRELPMQWAGFYAFNPIILVSFAAEAHFDILMICPLVWALVAAEKGRLSTAAGLAALAVGSKLICAPIVPFLLGWRTPRAWLVFAVVLVVPTLPFAADLLSLLGGVVAFGAQGHFNGPFYGLLAGVLHLPSPVPRLLLVLGFLGLWAFSLRRYGYAAQQRTTSPAALGLPEVGAFTRQTALVTGLSALILLSPIVHLWYLTWVIPFTVLRPRLHWLALSISAGLYLFVWDNERAGAWGLLPWQQVLLWAPLLVPLIYDFMVTRFVALKKPIAVPAKAPSFSVVVPCLRAESALPHSLDSLAEQTAPPAQVIIAAAHRELPRLAETKYPFLVHWMSVPPGRGNQIHAAIRSTAAPWIIVLHADSSLPRNALAVLAKALQAAPEVVGGAFGQRFEPPAARTLPIEILNDARSLLGQMAFGDQVQFFRRDLALEHDLVPAQPLMEDVELSCRLRTLGPTLHLGINALSHATRWHDAPWLRRFWLVMRLSSRYHFARFRSPARAAILADDLYRQYYGTRAHGCLSVPAEAGAANGVDAASDGPSR